jgi:hypothetical protein
MPQKFAFTTAAMAAALEETPVSYEDLADIERDFDDAETDISEFLSDPRQNTSHLHLHPHHNPNAKPPLQPDCISPSIYERSS